MRKEALRLLQALMLHNPFGPKLPVDRFEASLATHRAMLEQLVPPGEAGGQGDAIQENIQVEGGAAEGQAGEEGAAAAAAGNDVAIKPEPGAERSAEEMEVDGEEQQQEEVEEEAAEAEGEGAEEAPAPAQPARSRE